jgi:hypothetical protein
MSHVHEEFRYVSLWHAGSTPGLDFYLLCEPIYVCLHPFLQTHNIKSTLVFYILIKGVFG